mgnify:CR=1 FL=1
MTREAAAVPPVGNVFRAFREVCLRRVLAGRAGALRAKRGGVCLRRVLAGRADAKRAKRANLFLSLSPARPVRTRRRHLSPPSLSLRRLPVRPGPAGGIFL